MAESAESKNGAGESAVPGSDAGTAGAGDYTLVVHIIPGSIPVPSVSPFVLKLETYLRIAGLKYTIDTKKPFGAKGKSPWITFNGQDVDDSAIIIDFLTKKLNLNLWGNATREEKATAHAMLHMLESHLLLGLADWRWITGAHTLSQIIAVSGLKGWAMKFHFGRKVSSALWENGFTRHTPTERMVMIRKDLTAISDYLGQKAFILGDEPTEPDAVFFGVLAQFIYAAPGSPYEKIFEEEYKSVKDYVERMKQKFWPDWNSRLHKK